MKGAITYPATYPATPTCRVVSNYLLWRFVKNRISNLGERYTKVKQDYIKVLFGRQSQPERWAAAAQAVWPFLPWLTLLLHHLLFLFHCSFLYTVLGLPPYSFLYFFLLSTSLSLSVLILLFVSSLLISSSFLLPSFTPSSLAHSSPISLTCLCIYLPVYLFVCLSISLALPFFPFSSPFSPFFLPFLIFTLFHPFCFIFLFSCSSFLLSPSSFSPFLLFLLFLPVLLVFLFSFPFLFIPVFFSSSFFFTHFSSF